ncbi:hypothetical protein [Kordia jejudonensis]|uniref:hypothetical protein n=1 Tax=Kordia jejudonensis TaxID=1348245 RepID=UPI000629A658|nr:hypothetical protein [Kordia jejudonensis]
MRYLFILLLLCFGCKNTSDSKNTNPVVEDEKVAANFSFVDVVETYTIKEPFRLWQYRNNGKLLAKEEFEALQLQQIFGDYNSSLAYRLLASLNPSNSYNTLVFGMSDNATFGATHLATFDSNYNLISHIPVDHHGQKGGSVMISYLDGNSLFVENTKHDTAYEFIIRESGAIEKSNKPVTFKKYRYLGKFKGYLHEMPKRTVKAKNGLLVRDAEGKQIGKVEYGNLVYIIDYTKDSLTIQDEGKSIKAPKARIILDPKKITQGKDFYIEPSNIGYVFSGFLFNNNSNYKEDEFPYAYEFIRLGTAELEENATIDLRELFEITRVQFNTYKSKIVKKPTVITTDTTSYKKGKVLTLPFDNGKKLILKDSTYKSEYNPTRSFNVSFHEDFPDTYMVSENMFFMDDIYRILSKKTGDTLHTFRGYPYISPTKKYSVAIFHEFECMQQTYMVINKQMNDGTFQHYASLQPNSWSYPFKLDKNNNLENHFSIHWISDTEFIVYAKNAEECYLENALDYFYLKYKIK